MTNQFYTHLFQCTVLDHIKLIKTKKTKKYKQTFFINFYQLIAVGGIWDGKLKTIQSENGQILEVYSIHSETITIITSDEKENFLITGYFLSVIFGFYYIF